MRATIRPRPGGRWGRSSRSALAAGILATWLRLPVYVCDFGTPYQCGRHGDVARLGTVESVRLGRVQRGLPGDCLGHLVARRAGVPAGRSAAGDRRPERAVRPRGGGVGRGPGGGARGRARDPGHSEPCPTRAADRLAWIALAATAAALGICLWDRSAGFVLPGLYAVGPDRDRPLLGRPGACTARACLDLGLRTGRICLGVPRSLGLLLPRMRPVWRALRIPADREQPVGRLVPGGAGRGGGRGGRAGGVDLARSGIRRRWRIPVFGWPSGRMAGLAASILLLPASVAMAAAPGDRWRRAWQYARSGPGRADARARRAGPCCGPSGAIWGCTAAWSSWSPPWS